MWNQLIAIFPEIYFDVSSVYEQRSSELQELCLGLEC